MGYQPTPSNTFEHTVRLCGAHGSQELVKELNQILCGTISVDICGSGESGGLLMVDMCVMVKVPVFRNLLKSHPIFFPEPQQKWSDVVQKPSFLRFRFTLW